MRPFLEALHSGAGEKMVLQDNFFIEKIARALRTPVAISREANRKQTSTLVKQFLAAKSRQRR